LVTRPARLVAAEVEVPYPIATGPARCRSCWSNRLRLRLRENYSSSPAVRIAIAF